ncbi:MAG: hypothetical protein AAFP77_14820 [Bacteroidota bacterium]
MQNDLSPIPDSMSLTNEWSMTYKLTFRFLCIYLLLYIFPFPLDSLPFLGEYISEFSSSIWNPTTAWFGESVLGWGEISTDITGSGDKLANYTQMCLFLLLAGLGTLIWSLVDRQRINYEKVQAYLEIAIRYYLAVVLISYGCAKIFKTQFSSPGPYRLTEQIGDMSPMGLAWTFMGYSKAFNLFTGLGEALAGFLLFFRHTKVVGAFLGIAVMANIVAMNFCYDIPVKLFSTHLLLMLFFVLWKDIPRIVNFLFRNKAVAAADFTPPWNTAKYGKLALGIKAFFILGVLYLNISTSLEQQQTYGDNAPRPPLYGIHEMSSFSTSSQLTGDSLAQETWKELLVQWPGTASIRYQDGSQSYYGFETDTVAQTVHLYSWRDSLNSNATFQYEQTDTTLLLRDGVWKMDTLTITFAKKDLSSTLLLGRGFNWVSEYPYNR